MSRLKESLEEIIRLRETITLKAHLLELDLKQQWTELSGKCDKLEQELEKSLLEICKIIGDAEEEYFIGDEQEIHSLLEDFQDLHAKVPPKTDA